MDTTRPDEAADEAISGYNCGLNSLYLLLRLWGEPVELPSFLGRPEAGARRPALGDTPSPPGGT